KHLCSGNGVRSPRWCGSRRNLRSSQLERAERCSGQAFGKECSWVLPYQHSGKTECDGTPRDTLSQAVMPARPPLGSEQTEVGRKTSQSSTHAAILQLNFNARSMTVRASGQRFPERA